MVNLNDENKYFGKMPIRQDTTVLKSDVYDKEINFKVFLLTGVEIFKLEVFRNTAEFFEDTLENGFPNKNAIFSIDGIKAGDMIAAPTAMGGFCKAEVIEVSGKKGTARSGDNYFSLSFGEDVRGCWICDLHSYLPDSFLNKLDFKVD